MSHRILLNMPSNSIVISRPACYGYQAIYGSTCAVTGEVLRAHTYRTEGADTSHGLRAHEPTGIRAPDAPIGAACLGDGRTDRSARSVGP